MRLSCTFLTLLILFSCGENSAGISDGAFEGSKEDTLTTFKWDLAYFGQDSIRTHVRLIIRSSSRSDTLEIIDIDSPLRENGYPVEPDSAITGTNILTASGWYGGGGDAIFLMKEKGEYFLYWQQVNEESGWLPSDKIGEIILSSSPTEKASYIRNEN